VTKRIALSRLLTAWIIIETAVSLRVQARAAEVGPPKVGEVLEVKDTAGVWYKSCLSGLLTKRSAFGFTGSPAR
jgi:hypothetical protein